MSPPPRFFWIVAAVFAIGALSACSDAAFPAGLDDSDYDLRSMALQEIDLPEGYARLQRGEFNNEEFAVLFQSPDTDAKKRQLDAQGRLESYVTVFGWDDPIQHFGRPLTFTAQSTLYVDSEAALESMRTTCGLLVEDAIQLEEFFVPDFGDGGVGFSYSEEQDVIGESVELNVCFRTGRIVHAVAQSGLEGTQDIALSVRLAERMLERIELAFEEVDSDS